MMATRILFLKANVAGYTRQGPQGSVTVKPYSNGKPEVPSALPSVQKHPKSASSAEHHGSVVPPEGLHDDAVGFVARNPHRPERLSLFHRDGRASNHFGQDEDAAAVASAIDKHGLRMDARWHVFKKG